MWTREQLETIPPNKFEHLISNLWERKGYETTVRSQSHDRGVDVEADKLGRKEVIQVKRYHEDNTIGSQTVREYATLYQQLPTANQVIIVSSGFFTSQAIELAADLEVSLVNGDEVTQKFNKYDISSGSKTDRDQNAQSSVNNMSLSRNPLEKRAKEMAAKARGNVTVDRLLSYGCGDETLNDPSKREKDGLLAIEFFSEENTETQISPTNRHQPHYILWNNRGLTSHGTKGHKSSMWITDQAVHWFISVKNNNRVEEDWIFLIKQDVVSVEKRQGITKDRILIENNNGFVNDFFVNKSVPCLDEATEYILNNYPNVHEE